MAASSPPLSQGLMTPPSPVLDGLWGDDSRLIILRFHGSSAGPRHWAGPRRGPRLSLKIQALHHDQMLIRTGQIPLGRGFSGSSVWKYEANSSPNRSFSLRDQQKLNLTAMSPVFHGTIPNSVSLDPEGPGK